MLQLEQIKSITSGAIRIWEEAGWFTFSRFTLAQEETLRRRGFAPRELASAGIRLEFSTKGGAMSFDYEVTPGSGREYFGIEVTLDGWGIHHMYLRKKTHTDTLQLQIPASEKAQRVTVYFPNLSRLQIRNVALPQDYAACPRPLRYLAVGDSITQGYDAYHPNQTYANLLADAWNAQVVNQAIGGDYFCWENLDPELPFRPDIITVAYGTNDWKLSLLNRENVSAYLDKLTAIYPGVPVLVLLPLWRQIQDEIRGGINLAQGRQIIAQAAQGRPNVHIIDCYRFVPMLSQFYYDGILHPNDMGFLRYAYCVEKAAADILSL